MFPLPCSPKPWASTLARSSSAPVNSAPTGLATPQPRHVSHRPPKTGIHTAALPLKETHRRPILHKPQRADEHAVYTPLEYASPPVDRDGGQRPDRSRCETTTGAPARTPDQGP